MNSSGFKVNSVGSLELRKNSMQRRGCWWQWEKQEEWVRLMRKTFKLFQSFSDAHWRHKNPGRPAMAERKCS